MSKYQGEIPQARTKGYFKKGDTGDDIKLWQKFLNWYVGKEVCEVDGVYGKDTLKYTKMFQTEVFSAKEADGLVGAKTLKKAKAYNRVDKVKLKGVDVSTWQGIISVANFKKAKSKGIDYVILRLGYTGSASKKPVIDNVFENNYKNAVSAGFPVGVYFYSLATTEAKAKEEANFCIKNLKGKSISFPVYIDMEDPTYQGKCSKATLAKVCNAFCNTISGAGYIAGVYASLSWFNNKIGNITATHTKWIAQYYKECQYKGDYDMWQYSSSEKVEGIATHTDVSWCYRDFAKESEPVPVPSKPEPKGYEGELPSIRVKKTAEEAIDDMLSWGKMIVNDNTYHYGEGGNKVKDFGQDVYDITHQSGCHFCNTNTRKKVNKIKKLNRSDLIATNWEHTYVCNVFVTAMLAHGALEPSALEYCRSGSCIGMNSKGLSTRLDSNKNFENLGKLPVSKLKKGDILVSATHMQAVYTPVDSKYIKSIEATSYIGKYGSSASDKSIRIIKKAPSYAHVYRFVGKIDADIPLYKGEYSKRVSQWQKFLNWYFDGTKGWTPLKEDGIFGDATEKAHKKWQKSQGFKQTGDVGKESLNRARAVKK